MFSASIPAGATWICNSVWPLCRQLHLNAPGPERLEPAVRRLDGRRQEHLRVVVRPWAQARAHLSIAVSRKSHEERANSLREDLPGEQSLLSELQITGRSRDLGRSSIPGRPQNAKLVAIRLEPFSIESPGLALGKRTAARRRAFALRHPVRARRDRRQHHINLIHGVGQPGARRRVVFGCEGSLGSPGVAVGEQQTLARVERPRPCGKLLCRVAGRQRELDRRERHARTVPHPVAADQIGAALHDGMFARVTREPLEVEQCHRILVALETTTGILQRHLHRASLELPADEPARKMS